MKEKELFQKEGLTDQENVIFLGVQKQYGYCYGQLTKLIVWNCL
jgi:hypothetical protein